jgi:hypothetical protein
MTGFAGHLQIRTLSIYARQDDMLNVKGGHQLPVVGDILWSCKCRNQNYSTA